MLILFSGSVDGSPPVLPTLSIKDAETLINTPVAGNTGWDSDFLQAQTMCNTPMTFSDPELGLAALAETGNLWCQRKSKALVRLNFSDSGANAVVRPKFIDSANIVSIGPSVTITAIARQDGAAYMAPLETFELYGASKVALIIDSISAGTVDYSIAGV